MRAPTGWLFVESINLPICLPIGSSINLITCLPIGSSINLPTSLTIVSSKKLPVYLTIGSNINLLTCLPVSSRINLPTCLHIESRIIKKQISSKGCYVKISRILPNRSWSNKNSQIYELWEFEGILWIVISFTIILCFTTGRPEEFRQDCFTGSQSPGP